MNIPQKIFIMFDVKYYTLFAKKKKCIDFYFLLKDVQKKGIYKH